MHKNKTLDALKMLDAAEMRRFHEFVHSPYINKHERLCQLADVLMTEYPLFADDILEKRRLYKVLFPEEKKFNLQKVSDLFTYIYRLLEEFLAIDRYRGSLGKQIDLLASLREHKVDKLFESTMGKQDKRVRKTGFAGSEDRLLYEYRREGESDLYFIGQDSRTQDKSIERKSRKLDHLYVTAKLRQACEMKNRENIVNERYDTGLLDEVLTILEKRPELTLEEPAIALYYAIWKTLNNAGQEAHYYELVSLLYNNREHLPVAELRAMYDYAQNYCIKKINSGNEKFLGEIFKLYKTLLEHNIIFVDDVLSQWDYKNIVTVGMRLKEFDWTEDFMHRYRERLPEAERENAYAYNLANYYYSRGLYDKALELLRDVQFTDVYYGLGARSLLLKVYYEAEEYDPLYSLFDSFKIYLRRNKLVSEYQYRAHMGLVRFTKKLADLRLRLVSARPEILQRDMEKFRRQVEVATEITNLSWLRTELSKLEAEANPRLSRAADKV